MKSHEIRKKFLEFFKNKSHTIVRSDTLVPKKDPTLLFTTAGMVQFKPLWIGAPLTYSTAVSVQKCLRAGGKGSDLENVGKTVRHHTFFEMLGNFSFGDYFKQEAILFAWEFLIDVLKMDKERLWVSVYKDDEEAYDIWKDKIGFPEEKIVRLGEADNFWGPAGDTGACGPCSEIYIDMGQERSCGSSDCKPGCECERYLEFWNIVFPEYDQQEDGSRPELERRGIDTGMGLERLCTIMQNVENNYQTDLFKPIIQKIQEITNIEYIKDNAYGFHVIADHVRALTFTIAEHIVPSNEGRGYVLRRILRRACRFGLKIGMDETFIYKLVPIVVDIMKETYPELVDMQDHVSNVIKTEEESFRQMLETCSVMLDEIMEISKQKGVVDGADIFKLYDTYGLPLDMIGEIAEDNEIKFDVEGFNNLMQKQKDRARKDRKGKDTGAVFEEYNKILSSNGETEFVGYNKTASKAKLLAILDDKGQVDSAKKDQEVWFIFDKTPFYGESGGQVGDKGMVLGDDFEAEIMDSQKPIPEICAHQAKIIKGNVNVSAEVHLEVDVKYREQVAANHTATHILHNVLREVLGDNVKQAGSFVGQTHLRFDFTHQGGLTQEQLNEIECRVNSKIIQNAIVEYENKPYEQAVQSGVIALFGEKYEDVVRVLSVGDYSKELCGGIHVERTGDIGVFKIITETSAAAGIRRIEAVTGLNAYNMLKEKESLLGEVLQTLKISEDKLIDKIISLVEEIKEKDKIISNFSKKQSIGKIDEILKQVKVINDINLITQKIEVSDIDALKNIVDKVRKENEKTIIVLASIINKKGIFIAGVSEDLVKQGYSAGDLVKEAAKVSGGGGGGRSDFAQAGCKDVGKIDEALRKVFGFLSA